MRTARIGTTLGICLATMLASAGCTASKKEAPVAPPPPPPVAAAPTPLIKDTVGAETVTAQATVKAINLKTRRVTLQRPDGSLVKFTAGKNVRNLPQVRVGDVVTVTYYEALAYEVRKAGQGSSGAGVAEEIRRAEPGEKPGGAGARVTKITATITAIDMVAKTVTLRLPNGETMTVKARHPERLNEGAVGDLVEITYTEAIAVSVDDPVKHKAAKKKK